MQRLTAAGIPYNSIGFMIWSSVIWSVAQCQIETVTMFPTDGSFIRNAGRFVDEAFGMAAGYNVSGATYGSSCAHVLTPLLFPVRHQPSRSRLLRHHRLQHPHRLLEG